MSDERVAAVGAFYTYLADLRERLGGYRYLRTSVATSGWPNRGVYLFFDHREPMSPGGGFRVVRVGTHAVSARSQTTLWRRLGEHRGYVEGEFVGGGNHRGSVFRLHVGHALIRRDSLDGPGAATWGAGTSASAATRQTEHPIELAVSEYIRALPILWVAVDGAPGVQSLRRYVERQAIALLSGARDPVSACSSSWLGRHSDRPAIRQSGLWNVNHVEEAWEERFLEVFAGLVRRTPEWTP
jgi:hypothetical protein